MCATSTTSPPSRTCRTSASSCGAGSDEHRETTFGRRGTVPREAPFQDRTNDRDRREVDARGAQRHDEPEALQALVVCENPEESEAGGRDIRAQQQGRVAHVPSDARPTMIVTRFEISMKLGHAILVSRAVQNRQAEEV